MARTRHSREPYSFHPRERDRLSDPEAKRQLSQEIGPSTVSLRYFCYSPVALSQQLAPKMTLNADLQNGQAYARLKRCVFPNRHYHSDLDRAGA
jgi:hypothetical protein